MMIIEAIIFQGLNPYTGLIMKEKIVLSKSQIEFCLTKFGLKKRFGVPRPDDLIYLDPVKLGRHNSLMNKIGLKKIQASRFAYLSFVPYLSEHDWFHLFMSTSIELVEWHNGRQKNLLTIAGLGSLVALENLFSMPHELILTSCRKIRFRQAKKIFKCHNVVAGGRSEFYLEALSIK